MANNDTTNTNWAQTLGLLAVLGGLLYFMWGPSASQRSIDDLTQAPPESTLAVDVSSAEDSTQTTGEDAAGEANTEQEEATASSRRTPTRTVSSGRSTGGAPSGSTSSGRQSSKSSRSGSMPATGSPESSVISRTQDAIPKEEHIQMLLTSLQQGLERQHQAMDEDRSAAEEALGSLGQSPSYEDFTYDITVGTERYDRFDDIILRLARKYDVDPLMVKAIIKRESNFKPGAQNPTSTAAGLMQVIAGTYRLVWGEPDNLASTVIERRLTTNNNEHRSAAKHAIETGIRYLARYAVPNATSRRNAFWNYYAGHMALDCIIQGSSSCIADSKRHRMKAAAYAKGVETIYQDWAAAIGYEFKGYQPS